MSLTAYIALGLQKGIQTDKINIQPRMGLAWDPRGNGKSVRGWSELQGRP